MPLLASCFGVVWIVVAFWRILFAVRFRCSGAALVRIWRIASELFIFTSELFHVAVPLATVEADRALLVSGEAFTAREDLGRDFLHWIELSLRRAEPFAPRYAARIAGFWKKPGAYMRPRATASLIHTS